MGNKQEGSKVKLPTHKHYPVAGKNRARPSNVNPPSQPQFSAEVPKAKAELTQHEKLCKSEEYKNIGNQYFSQGQYDIAISQYRTALKFAETSILYSNIARCFLSQGKTQECINNCAQALSLNSTNFKAIVMMGDSSLILAENAHNPLFCDQAETYYQKAIAACCTTGKGVNMVEINKKILDCRKTKDAMLQQIKLNRLLEFKHKINMILDKKRQDLISQHNINNQQDLQHSLDVHDKHTQNLMNTLDKQISTFEEEKKEVSIDRSIYECIFTYEPMNDPHATTAGNSYDKEQIVAYLKKDSRDPLSRQVVDVNQLYPNKALKRAVDHFIKS